MQDVEIKETRLLLLGGTGEARELAERLHGRAGVETIVSLAGATRHPRTPLLPTRIGGFGGEGAQEAFLRENRIGRVIDATHPFAHRISRRTAAICARLGIPYLQLLRPEWVPGPQDRWTAVDDEAGACGVIPAGSTVFLATGRQSLEAFRGLSGCRVICRLIDPPEGAFPFPDGSFLVGRPPFSVDAEEETFRRLGVDWLVVKNAGGAASRSKLDAARGLGLPVVMIRRPAQPDAPKVATVAEALDWLGA